MIETSKRVLVIEDNEDVREMIIALVGEWGHFVQMATDGLEGMEKILSGRPDCALVDLDLPGLDGYEIARRVRASPEGRAIRLIALSGYGRTKDRRASIEAGFDMHLVTPIDPDELSRLIDGEALPC
jgi:two-component system, sensor histidine kinase